MVERDQCALAHIVEQALHAVVEERQEVLHPGAPSALADGVVERIIIHGSERRHIPSPETRNGLRVDQGF